ncbi:MAG: PAS domain S-box protein [Bacteroidales bacterium]
MRNWASKNSNWKNRPRKMISTQEQLRKSNLKLEEQIAEVHKSQKQNHVLLENASEIITIYSDSGRILYVSPSIKSIMGYFPDELVGGKSTENIHPQDVDTFTAFFRDLISFPEQTRTLQYRYFTKPGEIVWLEARGTNFVSDPVIQGIVLNSRDISVQILAEKEQRMRAKMQALSENSLDIILRIDIFSRCTYINPMIESYSGLKPADFINKPLMDIVLDKEILGSWKSIFESVAGENKKRTEEMEFPTPEGKKFMMVNAIPEYHESGDIESVLLVCHDITEARKREELIKLKNKSISDSINYAYYIQSSLMPKEEDIQAHLPNSIMFYKPKDVVSGDYPWMTRQGDNIYIGAMDCTGHGVPGALMSLIGYFSQNEIAASFKNLTAGEALDRLHDAVVKTLRQDDEDSKTRDGMDASFCRINLKEKELHYAGAHRPLYYITDGNLQVIKGDKFPVGGTQYEGREKVNNRVRPLKPGDAIYIMTDGFPDQYGGPDGQQKYMSGRVRKLIAEHAHLSVFQMGKLFRDEFYNWKGDNKQMDDILIIGVKF